jgi:two-component system KDP operon response regulator KdpE
VLSARGEEQHQIRALDAGANDYVTKPFREGELMARIRAALRSTNHAPDRNELRIGDLRIDVLGHRVYLKGNEVILTPTEFKLLHLLASEAGRVMSHSHLLREVWGPSRVDELQYLRVYMKQLRQKIEDDPAQPQRLLTTPGVGYRLARRAT